MREVNFPGFHFFPGLFPRDVLRIKVFPADPSEACALSFSPGAVSVKASALVSSAGIELDDDELDAVAGGECEHCSCLSTDGGFQDSNSGGMGRKK